MKEKKGFWIAALALAAVLVGAGILYRRLSEEYRPDQLAISGQTTAAGEEEKQTGAGETAETGREQEASSAETGRDQEASSAAEQPLAPDFTVYDAEGQEVHLSDYRGTPVVLNFWASWCGPCQSEMPEFQAASEAWEGEICFLMVNMTDGARETVESASAFVAEKGYTFPVFYDTAYDAANTYGVYSLPTTYFIDADGYAIAKATGAIDAATLDRGLGMIVP